jgi:serine/threonine protein kinase
MAPEVVKNEPYSAKVDIWSLGCTVIEMYTGKRPWLDMTALAAVYSVSWHANILIYPFVTKCTHIYTRLEHVNHRLYPKICQTKQRIFFVSAS